VRGGERPAAEIFASRAHVGWWWIPLPLVAWLLLTPAANRAVMRAVVYWCLSLRR
jgi:hypothetical protein